MRYNYETLTKYCGENELQIEPIDKTKCTSNRRKTQNAKLFGIIPQFVSSIGKSRGFCGGCSKKNVCINNIIKPLDILNAGTKDLECLNVRRQRLLRD